MSGEMNEPGERETVPQEKALTGVAAKSGGWLATLVEQQRSLQASGPILGLVVVLVIFIVLIGLKGGLGLFLSLGNAQVLVHDNTIAGVAALGMLIIIISGGIDLSLGSVIALVTVVTMLVYTRVFNKSGSMAIASACAIPAGMATGGVCGLTNGLMITGLRVPPFVATLGMLSVARGLAIWLAGRQLLTFPSGSRPGWVAALAETQASHAIFYPGFWTLVLLALATSVFLNYTILGRYCYAIGSNESTARLCGVAIERTKVILYMLAGLFAGWAGILGFAHGDSGDPSGYYGFELSVIAAVVIGGASLTGGQGTVLGALIGVLILGVLENGVSAFHVPVEIKHILIGVIIIANTALSQWQRRVASG
jgi:ribose transport system permease protein